MSVVEVVQLLVSPVHRYMGRPSEGPSDAPGQELVGSVEVRRNLGIVGDRYYARPAHRDAAVTVMSAENLPLDINPQADLGLTRRNILLRGVDIDAYVGSTVSLDTGAGLVLLAVRRPARPCAWMDAVIGPGAQRALRGKGGVRCTPLTDGVLTVGKAEFAVVEEERSPSLGSVLSLGECVVRVLPHVARLWHAQSDQVLGREIGALDRESR